MASERLEAHRVPRLAGAQRPGMVDAARYVAGCGTLRVGEECVERA